MSQQNNNKSLKKGILSSIIFCIVLIVAAVLFLIYRQRIIDQLSVWAYKPSEEVTNLIKRSGMNDNGIFYYYASHPALYNQNSAAAFNEVCNNSETTTAILGCNKGSSIYIYVISDKQLDGISEVTAAHETLHAIYNRLSDSEKIKVDKLLEAEYTSKLAGDKYYSDLMAFDKVYEPGQRDNELHSIIGTEVANLDPALESYYSQYFSNRQAVVKLDAKYSGVFKLLKTKADNLSKQIDKLSADITSLSNQYNIDAKQLNNDINSFNDRAKTGDFISQSQFNYERAVLTSRATALSSLRATIQSDINNYQSMVVEYNSIATQSKKLYETINSTLVSSPSV